MTVIIFLAQLTLAKLTLFNRKRQGEVSKITVQDRSTRKKAVADQAMAQSLNQFEQKLLSVLERLEIKGKRGRIVPILITAEIAEWVKILLEHRHKFIAEDNQYLFANTCRQLLPSWMWRLKKICFPVRCTTTTSVDNNKASQTCCKSRASACAERTRDGHACQLHGTWSKNTQRILSRASRRTSSGNSFKSVPCLRRRPD